MRILHFADLHLGVETYGKTDPQTGLSTRLVDFLRALDELVDYAVEERVDLVLFCGDAYKSREPSQTHQREFARRIRRLVDAGIPVFLLVGNHDLPAAVSRATSLEIYDTLLGTSENQGLGGVYVAGKPGTHVVATAAGPVQVVALPWLTPGRFLAREGLTGPDGRSLTIDQVLERMEEAAGRFVEEQGEALDPDAPSLLAAHAALTGSLVREGSEKWMTVGRYPELLKSTLHPQLFDYVALGHMHQKQVLDGTTPMVYPGSLARVDFGEEEGEKGFYVVELDPQQPRGQRLAGEPEFRPVWTRPFVTVNVSPRAEDPTPEVLAAIERAGVSDAIVRVIVRLSRAQEPLLRETEVRQALQPKADPPLAEAGAQFVAYVKRDIIEEHRTTRLPAGVRPESLTPLEALSLYLDDRKIAADRREVLLRHAQALLAGEE
jgi:exonuclease SbcD